MRFLRHSRGSSWHVPFLSLGVASSSMTSHAMRLHGRDDHAPLSARWRFCFNKLGSTRSRRAKIPPRSGAINESTTASQNLRPVRKAYTVEGSLYEPKPSAMNEQGRQAHR
jgi:hypothetical protein